VRWTCAHSYHDPYPDEPRHSNYDPCTDTRRHSCADFNPLTNSGTDPH